jgi:predicted transcriptional regulator
MPAKLISIHVRLPQHLKQNLLAIAHTMPDKQDTLSFVVNQALKQYVAEKMKNVV